MAGAVVALGILGLAAAVALSRQVGDDMVSTLTVATLIWIAVCVATVGWGH